MDHILLFLLVVDFPSSTAQRQTIDSQVWNKQDSGFTILKDEQISYNKWVAELVSVIYTLVLAWCKENPTNHRNQTHALSVVLCPEKMKGPGGLCLPTDAVARVKTARLRMLMHTPRGSPVPHTAVN